MCKSLLYVGQTEIPILNLFSVALKLKGNKPEINIHKRETGQKIQIT